MVTTEIKDNDPGLQVKTFPSLYLHRDKQEVVLFFDYQQGMSLSRGKNNYIMLSDLTTCADSKIWRRLKPTESFVLSNVD